MRQTQHELGSTIWHAGEELTVTTDPYEHHSVMWQDCENKDGKIVAIVADFCYV